MRKHSYFALAAVSAIALVLTPAESAGATTAKKRSDSVRSSQSAPMSSSSDRNTGLGLATFYSVVNTPGLQSTALSGWFQLDDANTILVHLGIEDTSPFLFSTGGHFRHTVAGDRATGFHLGGGLRLGTSPKATGGTNAFAIAFQGLAGVHYTFPGLDRVVFSADGGPSFNVVDGEFSFTMGGFSPLFGLSVHYLF